MKYIENNGNITREYDVLVDVNILEEIIIELDTKCYRIVHEKIKVAAYSKDEALKRLSSAINSAGIPVNGLIEISNGYQDLDGNSNLPLVFDCDYLCKKSSQLVYILQKIINNYTSTLDFKNENNRLIDLLIGYKNSEELIPYYVRFKTLGEKIGNAFNNNDLKKLADYQIETQQLIIEKRNNEDFDFKLLSNLYQKAKDCFKLVLVSETVHYTYREKDSKIYKIGAIKKL